MATSEDPKWPPARTSPWPLTRVDPAIVRAASQRISQLPNPPDIDVDEFENAETVYEMFRLPTPASELTAALKAREWMDRLATVLENA